MSDSPPTETPRAEPRLSFSDLIFQEGFKDKEAGRLPVSLGVEVTNHCNLRCPMCPREIADRGYGNMDVELFKKIADEAAGERLVFLPQGFGESFIHPRFAEMLHYAHERGVLATMLVTNATYLSEKNVHTLIDAQVPLVNVSLDGPKKEVYEAIRVNASFEKVVEGVQRLFALRASRGSKLPHIILRMIRMPETEPYVEEFQRFWTPYLKEGDEILFSVYQTWNNSVEDKRIQEPNGLTQVAELPKKPACRMIYKTMQVYFDGRTTPCCYDYNCTMEIGNAKTQSVAEMWRGEKAEHYRRLHEDGRMDEIAICRGCQEYIP
jgi:radical SAM protein with 4Fe4S-binding SPASM domain